MSTPVSAKPHPGALVRPSVEGLALALAELAAPRWCSASGPGGEPSPHALTPLDHLVYLQLYRLSVERGSAEVAVSAKRLASMVPGAVAGTRTTEGTVRRSFNRLDAAGLVAKARVTNAGCTLVVRLDPRTVPSRRRQLAADELDLFHHPDGRRAVGCRDGWRCVYCVQEVRLDTIVLEHHRGQSDAETNAAALVTACPDCNARKGPATAEAYLRRLAKAGAITGRQFNERLRHITRVELRELRIDPELLRDLGGAPAARAR